MKTPPHAIVFVLIASILGSVGAVFLKAGAGRLHRNLSSLVFNWRLAAGVVVFLVSSYFWVRAVKDGELAVLYPMLSVGYIFTLLWSRLVFGEPVTRRKIAGLGLIAVGLVLLNLGNR